MKRKNNKKQLIQKTKDNLFEAIAAICKDYNDKHLKTIIKNE
jgi:hypothetical protein